MRLREMAVYYVAVTATGTAIMATIAIVGLKVFHLEIYAIVYAQLFEYAFTCLWGLRVLFMHARWSFSWDMLNEPLRYGYPLLPSGLARLLMQLCDRYVLRLFRDLGQVGVYSFGYSISEAVDAAVVNPMLNGVLPTIRQLESKPDEQKRFIVRAATVYYSAAVFMALGLSILAREIVMILGRNPEYWAAQAVIPILSLAFVQQALGLFLDWGLVMKNKTYHMSAILVAAAGLNLGMDFLLIPQWGLAGAATAMVITWTSLNVMKMYFSAKFYQLRFELRRLLHVTVLGAGLYLLSRLLPVEGLSFWLAIPIKLAFAGSSRWRAWPRAC